MWPVLNEKEWVNISPLILETFKSLIGHLQDDTQMILMEQQRTITMLQKVIIEQRDALKVPPIIQHIPARTATTCKRKKFKMEKKKKKKNEMKKKRKEVIPAPCCALFLRPVPAP
jgi:hypothetical protein